MDLPVRKYAAALLSRDRRLDWALGLLGFGFGAWSLPLPFGRDQGLYYYVGREWFLRGAIPYRDVFEQKTPGIFLVYGLSVELFGRHLWSERLLELLCVVALGLASAFALTVRGERPVRGLLGGSVFAASFLYYGIFDFWNTGQCEIWCAGFCMLALASALRMERERLAGVVSGLLMGIAFVFKPPCATIFPAIVLAYAWRVRGSRLRRALGSLAALGAAAAVAPLAILAYLGAKGALPATRDVLVDGNGYYWKHERGAETASEVVRWVIHYYRMVSPLSTWLVVALAALALISARRAARKNLWRHLLSFACGAGGLATVISQLKFCPYHFGIMIMGMTMTASTMMIDGIALLRERRVGRWVPALVSASLVVSFLFTDPLRWWSDGAYLTWQRATGKLDDLGYAEQFAAPGLDFNARPGTEVSLWLRANTKPDDVVLVRGFEPQIYAMSDRYYDGRWFWTSFLTLPSRAYRRTELLAEDESWFTQHPPTYVVALDFPDGIDSAAYFTRRGYEPRHRVGHFVVMSRPLPITSR